MICPVATGLVAFACTDSTASTRGKHLNLHVVAMPHATTSSPAVAVAVIASHRPVHKSTLHTTNYPRNVWTCIDHCLWQTRQLVCRTLIGRRLNRVNDFPPSELFRDPRTALPATVHPQSSTTVSTRHTTYIMNIMAETHGLKSCSSRSLTTE